MLSLKVLVFLAGINHGLSQSNYTFTFKMAAKCKEYNSQHGYKYETFFKADSVASPTDPSILFEMHFAILAANNGHVLLSSVPEPTAADPVYEFVIGGGGNKFTELRRNLRTNAKGSVITRGILSPIEFRAFYIKIDDSGTVQFGKEGDPLPLINFVDADPISVGYFSFASWRDEAKYLFDCPVASGNGTEVAPSDSKEVENKMTSEEKLKKSILQGRSRNMPPASTVDIDMDFIIRSVKYDAFTSKLTTEFLMIVKWKDDSMAWNPLKFNDTFVVSFKPTEIWSPTFIEASSINGGPINLGPSTAGIGIGIIGLTSWGVLTYSFTNKFDTYCADTSNKLNRWPNDQYECQLVIESWNVHQEIKLILGAKGGKTKPEIHKGWEMQYTELVLNKTEWSSLMADDFEETAEDNVTSLSDRLVINVFLKRVGTTYNIVFYVPLIVLMSFVLVSFWTSPLTMSRTWFYAGSSTVISLGLSYVDYFVPCHTVPSILILYTCVLGGTLLALVVNVALLQAPEQTVFRGRYIQTFLTTKWVRVIFFLPDLKTCQVYETIDDNQSNLEDSRSMMEEMQNESSPATEREECVVVVDKIMFTVYSITFAVLLACHY